MAKAKKTTKADVGITSGTLAENRQARFKYEVLEELETGIVLTGTEIKSLRAGGCNMRDCFARVRDGEVWLTNLHISPYIHGNVQNHEPTRPRKLLLHRREIDRLTGLTQEKGLTLIPFKLYLRGGKAKVKLCVCRGKKTHDKRQAVRERTTQRELDRTVKRAMRR